MSYFLEVYSILGDAMRPHDGGCRWIGREAGAHGSRAARRLHLREGLRRSSRAAQRTCGSGFPILAIPSWPVDASWPTLD